MSSDRLTGFSSAFDELLERSRRELDALSGGSGEPTLSPTHRASSSPSAAAARSVAQSVPTRASASPPVSRSTAERALDDKLGAGWRYEILDRTRDGGELIVRCRVTAPARGISRTWYGSVPLSGVGRGGVSGMTGTTGNVRFTLGAGPSTSVDKPLQIEREAERQAIESALSACARLLSSYTPNP